LKYKHVRVLHYRLLGYILNNNYDSKQLLRNIICVGRVVELAIISTVFAIVGWVFGHLNHRITFHFIEFVFSYI